MLNEIAELYRQQSPNTIVEPAHMELAEPTIAQAFDRCVEQGAKKVIVQPFFLFPGRHWYCDIPDLVMVAARKHPKVSYLVTAPLGAHSQLVEVLQNRMRDCVRAAEDASHSCSFCDDQRRCTWRASSVRSESH